MSQVLQQGLSFGATLVLVRLLTPADFGLVALATTVLGLSFLLLNVGLGAVIVKRKTIEPRVVDTLFWAAVIGGVALALVLALSAPALAALLGQPSGAVYLRVLGAVVVLSMAAGIPGALLQRRLQFRQYYRVQTLSVAVYVAVEIGGALAGVGALCVVYGQVAMSVVTLVGWSVAAAFRPGMQWDLGVLRGELGYSAGWFSVQTVQYLTKNADYWAVSRGLGPQALGAYYVAFVLPALVRQRLGLVAGTVLFPIFAALQADPVVTRRAYASAVVLQVAVAGPALVGVAVLADPVVQTLFGPQWGAAATVLPWLAPAALIGAIGQTLGSVALARGEMRRSLYAQGAGAVVLVAGVILAVASGQGLVHVGVAVLVAAVVTNVAQQLLLGKPLLLPFSAIGPQLLALGRPLVVMGAALLVGRELLDSSPPVVELLVLVPVGAVVYLASARLLAPAVWTMVVRDGKKLLRRGDATAAPASLIPS